MSRIRIYPYQLGSRGAKALAKSLGVLRIKRKNSKFKTRSSDVIINWGNCVLPYNIDRGFGNIVNPPIAVRRASNKLKAFEILDNVGLPIPPYTTCKEEALNWLGEGKDVVVRHVLNGHSGEGIEIVKRGGDELPDAPLYTAYLPKANEFRVHVVAGRVVDFQRKMRKRDVPDEEVNWKVRNLKGGFIFGRNGVELPPYALETAVHAVTALGLHFGAVDLVETKVTNEFVVIEINTAPGLTGTTLEKYTEAFENLIL